LEIPEKIKIGGLKYDVEYAEKMIYENRQTYGHIDQEMCKIQLDKTLKCEQSLKQTFIHEILHGICFDRNIDMGDKEEDIVDQLAHGLLQVIIDNPGIFNGN